MESKSWDKSTKQMGNRWEIDEANIKEETYSRP